MLEQRKRHVENPMMGCKRTMRQRMDMMEIMMDKIMQHSPAGEEARRLREDLHD